MKRVLVLVLLVLASLFTVAAPAAAEDDPTLFDIIENDPRYATLVAALEATGLDAAIDGGATDITLLAPSEGAFQRTLNDLGLTVDDLVAQPDLLETILLYHVVPVVAPESTVLTLDSQTIPTLQGEEIHVDVRGQRIFLNGNSRVTRTDHFGSNGVIHTINRVLLPPSIFGSEGTLYDQISERDNFSILKTALELTGLDAALDDPEAELTLLAPNNNAFERALAELGITLDDLVADTELLTQILLYHVIEGEVREDVVRTLDGQEVPTLQGETVTVDIRNDRIFFNFNNRVIRTNFDATNGVYHQINRVLLPPSIFGFNGTIFDQVESRSNFSILEAALVATGLDEALDGRDDLTLLAPTNNAFNQTLSELGLTLDDLLAQPELLTQILLYHVIEGEVREDAVRSLDGQSAPTLQGEEITIDVRSDTIFLNFDIPVIFTDIEATNGVFHAINRVLLPPSVFGFNGTLFDQISERDNFSILTTALELTGLDAALDDPEAELTLLAPNDEAFERTLSELGITLEDLVADPELVETILLYHVVPVVADEATVRSLTAAPTLQGEEISIEIRDDNIFLNVNAQVVRTDAEAINGLYHVVHRVLLPPSIFGFNGTIYDDISSRDNFSILTTALELTGLDEVLDGNEKLTLLAPTNAAFERTLSDLGLTLEDLVADPELVETILLYHVIEGEVDEATVRSLDGQAAPTVLGQTISIEVIDGHIFLNDDVRVFVTDREATNGLYHVINRVLIPELD